MNFSSVKLSLCALLLLVAVNTAQGHDLANADSATAAIDATTTRAACKLQCASPSAFSAGTKFVKFGELKCTSSKALFLGSCKDYPAECKDAAAHKGSCKESSLPCTSRTARNGPLANAESRGARFSVRTGCRSVTCEVDGGKRCIREECRCIDKLE